MRLVSYSSLLAAVLGTTVLSGCSPKVKEWEPDKKTPEIYSVAFRKYAPQPTYARLRWVHAPDPLPERRVPQSSAGLLAPVLHLDLANVTLEEAVRALASVTRYDSYCASTIAPQHISINALGTVDELVQKIASQAGIYAVVDHDIRQIRFMANRLPQAELLPEQISPSGTGSTEPQFLPDEG